MSKEDIHLFYSLARAAEKHKHFAFFLTSLNNFELAVGAKRVCEIAVPQNAITRLREFQEKCEDRIVGFLGYDLKNGIENLSSKNTDPLEFPEALFFEPLCRVAVKNAELIHISGDIELFKGLQNSIRKDQEIEFGESVGEPLPTIDRDKYLECVEKLHQHLKRGDIYEANFCMQYLCRTAQFDPLSAFIKLHALTEAPFSVFSRLDSHYILSGSPERFLKNNDGRLLSQPIKGTRRRAIDSDIDTHLKNELRNDPKEQSENVMIVDLVRNDLSRVAKKRSVKVEKLFEVQSFKTVHHMVSSIACELDTENFDHWQAIESTFPMGSMTGAPKISAMKIIDSLENFKRGAYSGAFGWMDPNGNFDFNVLIRTILYNQESGTLGFAVGSAITITADAMKEYEECALKANALLKAIHVQQDEELIDLQV
jgi:para-aminobenzoate synthetase component 1